MHQHGPRIQWAARQIRNERAEHAFTSIAASIDPDFQAIALFAVLVLALSLLGLALSSAVLQTIPPAAEGFNLLAAGS